MVKQSIIMDHIHCLFKESNLRPCLLKLFQSVACSLQYLLRNSQEEISRAFLETALSPVFQSCSAQKKIDMSVLSHLLFAVYEQNLAKPSVFLIETELHTDAECQLEKIFSISTSITGGNDCFKGLYELYYEYWIRETAQQLHSWEESHMF